MNDIEVRYRAHPLPLRWALYGHDCNGAEFGLVYDDVEELRKVLKDLLRQIDKHEGVLLAAK